MVAISEHSKQEIPEDILPPARHTLALCILEAASIINFACIALHKYIYTQYTPVSIYCITLGYRLTYNMHGIEILKIIKN